MTIPTWAEVNGYLILVAIGLAFCVYAWVKGTQEEKNTVTWIRDWRYEK